MCNAGAIHVTQPPDHGHGWRGMSARPASPSISGTHTCGIRACLSCAMQAPSMSHNRRITDMDDRVCRRMTQVDRGASQDAAAGRADPTGGATGKTQSWRLTLPWPIGVTDPQVRHDPYRFREVLPYLVLDDQGRVDVLNVTWRGYCSAHPAKQGARSPTLYPRQSTADEDVRERQVTICISDQVGSWPMSATNWQQRQAPRRKAGVAGSILPGHNFAGRS